MDLKIILELTQNNRITCPAQRPRCLVYLLDLSFSKFPTKAMEMDVFYLPPKKQVGSSIDLSWYECAAVGKEKLRTFMELMCRDAGIAKKTNRSLRATGASALFHAGVPEKLIRDVTGHCTNALQLYERPTDQQRKQVSEVLVQGREFGKENMPASTSSQSSPPPPPPAIQQDVRRGASMCNSGFSGCKVTILPQNFTVNICPTTTNHESEDVKNLLDGIDLLCP